MKLGLMAMVIGICVLCTVPIVASGANISSFTVDKVNFNPYSEGVTYSYLLNIDGDVTIFINNSAMVNVRTFDEGHRQSGTTYTVAWDGKDGGGNVVPVGDYSATLMLKYPDGTYEYATSWGGFATGLEVTNPMSVVVDKYGYVYVADNNGARLAKYDSDGNLIDSYIFGETIGACNPSHLADRPWLVAYDPEHDLIYTRTYSVGLCGLIPIDVFDLNLVHQIRHPGFSTAQYYYSEWAPIYADSEGYFYLFGAGGSAPNIYSIAKIDVNNNLVWERGFDAQSWGAVIASPVHGSLMYVLHDSENQVVVYDPAGVEQFSFGSGQLALLAPGPNWPWLSSYGIALDNDDNVFVADTWHNRIVKYSYDGTYFTSFGEYGTAPENMGPQGVAVDTEGNIYVADSFNFQVDKWVPRNATETANNNVHVFVTTTVSLGSSINPSRFGQPVTFQATVNSAGGTPTGTVQFRDGSTNLLPTQTLTGGTASYTTSALTRASHQITAVYTSNTPDFISNESAPLTQVVNKADTSILVSSSQNPIVTGIPVTFTATVSVTAPGAGTPTGTVTFKDGTATLGTGTVSTTGGITTATFSTSTLSEGSHSITAAYEGDTNFNLCTSSTALVQQINPPPRIGSFGPPFGSRGVTMKVGITGTGFQANLAAKLTKTGAPDIPVTILQTSSTSISGTIAIPPNAPTGLRILVLSNTDGGIGTRSNAFTVR